MKMLKPRILFGLNTNIRKNVCYISDKEVLYPVSGVITIHNFKQESQRHINLPNVEKQISVITVSLKKKCIAIAEKGGKNEKPKIYIYDIETLVKKKTLGIPFDVNTEEFICVSFSYDSNYLAALTGNPDYIMYYYNWQNAKIESQAKANNPPSAPGPVTDMALNPRDSTIIVFVGIGLFRLVSMSENVWRQYGFQKAQNFAILSVCWLEDDRVLAGCKDGKIIIVQSGDLNGVYDVNEITQLNVIPASENKKFQVKTLSRTISKHFLSKLDKDKKDQQISEIKCCIAVKTGFFFSQKPGEITYFEKTDKTTYKKSTTFVIKKDVLSENTDYNSLYSINYICTNLDNSSLLCTTNRSQIYWIELQQYNSESIVELKIFGQPLHHGSITGLSTCLWKPIFMTCGADNSVRLWNHKNMKLLLNQTFTEIVKCISLHPTGLYALIGFSDKVRFLLVLIEELQTYREFSIPNCQTLSFSNNGHLFAVECSYDILVYSSITFKKISCFKGHYKQITSLQWSDNDFILYSSSINGAIYEWSINKGRLSDVILPDVEIKGLIALDSSKIICITSDGYIKEIQNTKVTLSKKLNDENASHLDLITKLPNNDLLLASKNGLIIWLKYPLDDEPEFNYFLMHSKTISQFCLVNNNQSLISCDIAGTICIWNVTLFDNDKTIEEENYFEEILVNTDELDKKNQKLKHLSCRITEIGSEHSFEIRQLEKENCEKIQELQDYYNLMVKNLKKKIKTLEKEHSMELNRIHLDITQMKQTYTSQMDQLDSNYNAKLLYEFQKYDTLKEEYEEIKNYYELEYENIKRTLNTENAMQLSQLQSEICGLKVKILQTENKLESEKEQNNKVIEQCKSEFEEEKNYLILSYESKLREETTNNQNLKTEIVILNKKLIMAQREKDEFKASKISSENDYKNLKQKYSILASQSDNLKKMLADKETLIKKEKIYAAELKEKIQKIIDEKSIWEKKITELNIQLQENQKQLQIYTEKFYELEKKIKKEEKQKIKLQTEIIQLSNKLKGNELILHDNRVKLLDFKTHMFIMKREIIILKDLLPFPDKLKEQVKVMIDKYSEN